MLFGRRSGPVSNLLKNVAADFLLPYWLSYLLLGSYGFGCGTGWGLMLDVYPQALLTGERRD